jgi:hypothetical protein
MAQMAAILLQQVVLRVGNVRYRLADIEFLYSRHHRPGPFIHGDAYSWGAGAGFITGRAVDLTFSNGTDAGAFAARGDYCARRAGAWFTHGNGPAGVLAAISPCLADWRLVPGGS